MGSSKQPSFSLLKLIQEVTNQHDIKTVNEKDAPQLQRLFTQKIKDLDAARRGLHSEKADIDPRGRVTIPKQYRTSLGMNPGTRVEVFPYPTGAPKGLMIKVEK